MGRLGPGRFPGLQEVDDLRDGAEELGRDHLVDLDRLRLLPPHVAFDLPAGGRRMLQAAKGYIATFVAGQAILEEGLPTGAMPGRLVRGPQRGA